MNQRHVWAVMFIGIVAGFAGGLLSSVLLKAEPVAAQTGLSQPEIIKTQLLVAQEIRIVDQNGKLVGRLGPGVFEGEKFIELQFFDPDGYANVSIMNAEIGGGSLVLAHHRKSDGLLSLNQEGLHVSDLKTKADRVSLSVNDRSGATFRLFDVAGNARILMGVTPRGETAAMGIQDAGGREIWSAGGP